MSELAAYLQLGFHHITDLRGADHILFLLALAAIYRFRDWRSVLWVVTAFTAGHSLTLALAVTGLLRMPTPLIEFLIPVTIVLTGVENLVLRERVAAGRGARHRPLFAGIFGLVHGAGFAGYLKSLFVARVAVPLFAFNLGIEIGQFVLLTTAVALFWALDRGIVAVASATNRRATLDAFQLRLVAVSALVTIIATGWAWNRWPA